MEQNFFSKLTQLQAELNVPKTEYNKFGNFYYRKLDKIFEEAKKLCLKLGLTLYINDEIEQIGDRYYIKATATITDGTSSVSTSAYAREALTKKGMDDAQVTGTSSTYARKYALAGLLCIDDNKDPDSEDNSSAPATSPHKANPSATPQKSDTETILDKLPTETLNLIKTGFTNCKTPQEFRQSYDYYKHAFMNDRDYADFKQLAVSIFEQNKA